MKGILDGLRVIEGSAFVAAPLGGMTLAALGADVIRFDDIAGGLDTNRWPVTKDGVSLYWAGLNKGKRSIAVDLRKPEGQELIAALITAPGSDAGIFSTNLPARGWLAYEALSRRRGDLVMVTIVGALDGSAQVDYTVNAVTGFPLITGPVSSEGPVNQVLPAWDIATGYAAATAILAAERHRGRTGGGQLVKLALQDIALSATAALGYLGEAEINAVDRPRFGNEVYGTFARDFATRDGRHVMICVFTARQLSALAEAGGFQQAFADIERRNGVDLRDEAQRWEKRGELTALIEPWIGSLTAAEAAERLTRAGALWGPYKTPRELIAGDPIVTDNPMFQRVVQPGIGELWSASSPFVFGAAARLPARPAPLLGQHTDEILSEILGLGDGAIGRLHEDGVVAGPRAGR
ncbi:MAG: CoA transferase [Hyphomicrobiaceae bacterium]|nr:CoA transferase [Hyphomicrobiaceae bacterium]